MIGTLRELANRVARVGVHPGLAIDLEPRVVLTNVVSAIVFVMCVPYIPVHLSAGSPIRAGFLAVEMVLLAFVFVSNASRRYLLARWLMLLTLDISVTSVTLTASEGSLVWVSLIAVAAMSSLPFTPSERVHAWAGTGLAIALGIVCYSGVLSPAQRWLGEAPFPAYGEVGIVVGSMLIAPALVFWQASAKDAHVTELSRVRADLEAQVARAGELASTLELRSEQAREASQAKSRFLAHMSHEIRTPLAAVISLVELARSAQTARERSGYLTTAEESAAHLLRILNDILDLSKVEQGGLDLDVVAFSLDEIVEDVVRLTRVRVRRPGVDIHARVDVEGGRFRLGDPLRLKQVLLNLMGNAAKFTSSGRIELLVDEDGERVRFCVTDTGGGMDRAQLDRVFDAFQQADPSISRTHGGTGLGLTISRHIVGRMGGELLAESELGVGSRFWFELPLPATDEPGRLVDEPSTAGERTLRLLVAEDNAVNRLIAERLLTRLGHRVEVVEDGREAVQRAFDGFDAVLMDVQMPQVDGLEATRRIRAIEAERGLDRLPIVALTANAMKGDREVCLAAGMDEHLAKPLDRGHAAEVLGRLVDARMRKGA